MNRNFNPIHWLQILGNSVSLNEIVLHFVERDVSTHIERQLMRLSFDFVNIYIAARIAIKLKYDREFDVFNLEIVMESWKI